MPTALGGGQIGGTVDCLSSAILSDEGSPVEADQRNNVHELVSRRLGRFYHVLVRNVTRQQLNAEDRFWPIGPRGHHENG